VNQSGTIQRSSLTTAAASAGLPAVNSRCASEVHSAASGDPARKLGFVDPTGVSSVAALEREGG
jgi:hypothetical protein